MSVFIWPFATGFLILFCCIVTSSDIGNDDRIDSEALDCDASRRCPRWMFCDERSSRPSCHSCSACTFDADLRHFQCTESIAQCSHTTTTDPRLFCGDVEVIPGANCSGLCRPLRAISNGFPVGTECTIQCLEDKTSISCQWNASETRANWNGTLPSGIRIRSTSTVAPTMQLSGITADYWHNNTAAGSVNDVLLVVVATGLGLVAIIAVVAVTVTCHRHRLKSTLQQIQHRPTATIGACGRKQSACENSEDGSTSEQASSNDIDENLDSLLTTVDTHRHAPAPVEHSETEEEVTSGLGSTSIMLIPDSCSEYYPPRINCCEEPSFLLSSTEVVRPFDNCRHILIAPQSAFGDVHNVSETVCKQL